MLVKAFECTGISWCVFQVSSVQFSWDFRFQSLAALSIQEQTIFNAETAAIPWSLHSWHSGSSRLAYVCRYFTNTNTMLLIRKWAICLFGGNPENQTDVIQELTCRNWLNLCASSLHGCIRPFSDLFLLVLCLGSHLILFGWLAVPSYADLANKSRG